MSGTVTLLQLGGYVGLLLWAGDIIANNLLEFAARRTRRAGGFAPEELDAIEAIHAERQ